MTERILKVLEMQNISKKEFEDKMQTKFSEHIADEIDVDKFCEEFNVSKEWLVNGAGSMFAER